MRGLNVTWMTVVAAMACTKAAPPAPSPAEPVTLAPAPAPAPTQPAHAEGGDPWTASQAPVVKDPLKRPLFWSIARDGKTSYALGTIHIGIDAEARLPQLVWDKLAAMPVFAMEIDASDVSLLGMGKRTDGKTLEAELGPVYWKKLGTLIEPRVLAGINGMKPAIAATMLSVRGLPMTAGMDGILLGRASNSGKRLIYLEPAQKQVALLERWMDIRTLKMLIDKGDAGIEESKQMLAAYVAGDEAKLAGLVDAGKAEALAHGFSDVEYRQQMNEMLYDRNAAWIPAIERVHAAGGGFIAVGAMHLIGPRSVLELLTKKGYVITRVAPPGP
jgi:uncharacterized protein